MGCRTEAEGLDKAGAIGVSSALELARVEGKERLMGADRSAGTVLKVDKLLRRLRNTAITLERSGGVRRAPMREDPEVSSMSSTASQRPIHQQGGDILVRLRGSLVARVENRP